MSYSEYLIGEIEEVGRAFSKNPEDLATLWFGGVLARTSKIKPEWGDALLERWNALEKRLSRKKLDQALRDAGVPKMLLEVWDATFCLHHSGAIHRELADWVLRLVDDPDTLRKFIYAHVKYNPGFGAVGSQPCKAIHRIALHTLAIDPGNQSAWWIYSNESFLKKIGNSKDIPVKDGSTAVREIRELWRDFEKRILSPADLACKLDTIKVDSVGIVQALIRALKCKDWRGVMNFCLALGRASDGKRLAVEALIPLLRDKREYIPGAAAKALGALGKDAVPALDPLLDVMEKMTSLDVWYQNDWVRALFLISPHAAPEGRARSARMVEGLVAKTLALPESERRFYGYVEFLKESKSMLKKFKAADHLGQGLK